MDLSIKDTCFDPVLHKITESSQSSSLYTEVSLEMFFVVLLTYLNFFKRERKTSVTHATSTAANLLSSCARIF